jgi:hypothetical protein
MHEQLRQQASEDGIDARTAIKATTYGHHPGRVHPLETKIQNCPPVVRPGAPNKAELKAYCKTSKGKRVQKALQKYCRKDWSKNLSGRELDEAVKDTVQGIFEAYWQFDGLPGSPYNHASTIEYFFDLLIHNAGTPERHSLDGQEGLLLLDFYMRLGGDLSNRNKLNGRAILHTAADLGLTHVIEWLGKNGADPNQCTGYNEIQITTASTAIHLAIVNVQPESVKALCKLLGIGVERETCQAKLHCIQSRHFPTT